MTAVGAAPIPVLITTAILASAPQTALSDADTRLAFTLESIRRWRLTQGVSQVVVCDGSGYDFRPHIESNRSSDCGAPCEVHNFVNNINEVRTRGKGFGEGEIINYALGHSAALHKASSFTKCTGKLWVENYAACIRGYNGIAALHSTGRLIDTRFYIVNKSFFMTHLANAHRTVQDTAGFYLEHAFSTALKEIQPRVYIMIPTPRIRGMSGSTGVSYPRQPLRALVRDGRSLYLKLFGKARGQ